MNSKSEIGDSGTNLRDQAGGRVFNGPAQDMKQGFLGTVATTQAPNPNEAMSIHLVHGQLPRTCHHWLGLNRPGSLSPAEILRLDDPGKMLKRSSEMGTNEGGPLLLTSTRTDPATYLFLLPKPADLADGLGCWVAQMMATIRQWMPKAIGIYLADPSLSEADHGLLLGKLLTASVRETSCRRVHLVTGSLGINFLLKISLEIKSELKESGVGVELFH